MALIRITLRSDLCVGSSEAVGVTVDNDICISPEGLPYIPGRCVKGCLRQAAERLQAYGCPEAQKPGLIDALFGTEFGKEGLLRLHQNAILPGAEAMAAWLRTECSSLPDGAARALNVEKLFTYVRGQTSMDDGIAAPGTLRNTRMLDRYNKPESREASFRETCLEVPVSLRNPSETGYSAEELTTLLQKSCQALRHMGSKRNRGLGNVKAELVHAEDLIPDWEQAALPLPDAVQTSDEAELRFQISLDASVTLPGCDETLLEIPARSVIGCAATAYLRTGQADDPLFRDLFLNGSVRWSALTPITGGLRAAPTPLMLVYLKNAKQYCNRYLSTPSGEKQKTLDGTYAAQTEDGFRLVTVDSHTQYHHSTKNGGTLYLQDSIDKGAIYGGTVILPAHLAQTAAALLRQTDFSFGRSRSAQYAACSLYGEPEILPHRNDSRTPAPGEPVYVVLQSDLLLSLGGIYQTDEKSVRAYLAQELGLEDRLPENCIDYCQYHTVGGYHLQWQLQKPQVPVIRGGSVYAFRATGSALPTWRCFGELRQEGFGLCRIYTAEEMKQLSRIEKANADQAAPHEYARQQCAHLKSALLVQAGREQIRAFIQRYNGKYRVGVPDKDIPSCKHPKNDVVSVRSGMIGRLRLILSDAADYADFLARVNTIKESDRSSGKKYSDRQIILALLKKLFGSNPAKPSVLPMLQDDRLLADAIQQDKDAADRLSDAWREPLDMLLHLAYYSNGRR